MDFCEDNQVGLGDYAQNIYSVHEVPFQFNLFIVPVASHKPQIDGTHAHARTHAHANKISLGISLLRFFRFFARWISVETTKLAEAMVASAVTNRGNKQGFELFEHADILKLVKNAKE